MGILYSIYSSNYIVSPFEFNKSYLTNNKNMLYKSVLLNTSYLYDKNKRYVYNTCNKGLSVVCAVATSLNYYSNNKYFSPAFIQYCVKLDLQDYDIYGGISIIDAINSINNHGICLEKHFPLKNAIENISPTSDIFDLAKNNKINYYQIKQLNTQMIHILSRGNVFLIGITLYNNFDYKNYNQNYNFNKNITDYKEIINLPTENDIVIGSKCFLVIGHNDIEEYFIILDCSNNIEYKISYDYLEDEKFSSDLFVIELNNNKSKNY